MDVSGDNIDELAADRFSRRPARELHTRGLRRRGGFAVAVNYLQRIAARRISTTSCCCYFTMHTRYNYRIVEVRRREGEGLG